MGNKVSRVIIAALVLVGCDKAERVTGPMWPPPKPIEPITLTPEFVGADAIAGFEARFFPFAGFSIKNTGTAKRWAYAYTTTFDSQTAVTASKYLLVNPGATWTDTFNKTCVQLDLSTQASGGRPDIGFAYYDKQGQKITSANLATKVAECRATQCISDRNNPNWNCQECNDAGVCLVPR